jgi:hypothetical protein
MNVFWGLISVDPNDFKIVLESVDNCLSIVLNSMMINN